MESRYLSAMNVSLPQTWEQFVASQVSAGEYGNASEVVREALRLLRNRPLVFILGLQPILDSVRFTTHENRVEGKLSIPEDQRAEIAERMALVAEQLGRRHASAAGKAEGAPEGSMR